MIKQLFSLMLSCTLFLVVALPAHAETVPRHVIALYDSRYETRPADTRLHQYMEMPANHLGMNFKYYDINEGLPEVTGKNEIRGVITWFLPETEVPDSENYLKWLASASDDGKKIVILGPRGIGEDFLQKPGSMRLLNRVLHPLGLEDKNHWIELTYRSQLSAVNEQMVGFERPLDGLLPSYQQLVRNRAEARTHLAIHTPGEDPERSELIVTSPHGGLVQEGYLLYTEDENDVRQWYIDPFEFLRLAFDTDGLPKPDTSTLAGRRIFYSHIDGDGWNNITEIEDYREDYMLASEVILKEVLEPYSDFPVTVGIIVSDIDMDCYGYPDSERVAREILALPHVEAGSHTHSHPLHWAFFKDANPSREIPYLTKYPPKPGSSETLLEQLLPTDPINKYWKLPSLAMNDANAAGNNELKGPHRHKGNDLPYHYDTPRSAACAPFNLDREVSGSVEAISKLAPEGKKVRIYQWSGDTSPFEAAIHATRENNIRNINGGDSRFDREFPSYAWVSPLGRQVGQERQIYSSNSNENTYTDLWRDRFYGFRYLTRTILNTETPRRVKPFNVYYHMYSGEKTASLQALKDNLNFARKQELTPVTTSHFAAIADGFYTVRLESLGENRWQVFNRDGLQTLRFDHAVMKQVDFERSKGVLGQRHYQGSLYVSLDPAVPSPIVALKQNPDYFRHAAADRPYLVESRWPVEQLDITDNSFRFHSRGFGEGYMRWQVPEAGLYRIQVKQPDGTVSLQKEMAGPDRLLTLHLEQNALAGLAVRIEHIGNTL